MKQRGQAASTMDVASGLLDHCRPCSFSDERQELGDDSSSAIALLEESPAVGRERFSFRSSPLELFLLLRLILGGLRGLFRKLIKFDWPPIDPQLDVAMNGIYWAQYPQMHCIAKRALNGLER